MKKIIPLAIISFLAAAAYAADAAPAQKKPGFGIDPSALGAAQKEEDKAKKEIDALVEKYKAASDADNKALKDELTKKVTAREEERIKKEREEIARQTEKLKTWSATLDNEEKNKTALVGTEVDNLISGKKAETPWDKLKNETLKKSEDVKQKALQKASAVKK